MTRYVLDCSDCVGAETERCEDCIVRYLVDRDPESPCVLDGDEAGAVLALAEAGLIPAPRHLRAVS